VSSRTIQLAGEEPEEKREGLSKAPPSFYPTTRRTWTSPLSALLVSAAILIWINAKTSVRTGAALGRRKGRDVRLKRGFYWVRPPLLVKPRFNLNQVRLAFEAFAAAPYRLSMSETEPNQFSQLVFQSGARHLRVGQHLTDRVTNKTNVRLAMPNTATQTRMPSMLDCGLMISSSCAWVRPDNCAIPGQHRSQLREG
jgi:hypothetical protein